MRKLSVNWGNNISFMEQHVWECVGGLKGPLSSVLMYVQEIGGFIQMQIPFWLSLNIPQKRFPKDLIQELIQVLHDLTKAWKSTDNCYLWTCIKIYPVLCALMVTMVSMGPKLIMGDFPCRSFISLKDKVQKKLLVLKSWFWGMFWLSKTLIFESQSIIKFLK